MLRSWMYHGMMRFTSVMCYLDTQVWTNVIRSRRMVNVLYGTGRRMDTAFRRKRNGNMRAEPGVMAIVTENLMTSLGMKGIPGEPCMR